MARYRHKTKEDLVWNGIRRRITREFDIAIADAREEALNDMLWDAWQEYTRALGQGKVLEIEAKYKALASAVVTDMIQPLEIASADMASK